MKPQWDSPIFYRAEKEGKWAGATRKRGLLGKKGKIPECFMVKRSVSVVSVNSRTEAMRTEDLSSGEKVQLLCEGFGGHDTEGGQEHPKLQIRKENGNAVCTANSSYYIELCSLVPHPAIVCEFSNICSIFQIRKLRFLDVRKLM